MRHAQIQPHARCNQACTFCHTRRAEDDRSRITFPAVRAQIDEAAASGAEVLVFGGGEPTLRADLAKLVRHAHAKESVKEVWLETNATLMDRARAGELLAAGVSRTFVHLSGWGDALDRSTRDPGGFERALAGLAHLIAAGLEVEIAVTLVRSNAEALPLLPRRLREHFGDASPRAMRVAVPIESPDASELLDYATASAALSTLDAAAQAAGMSLSFMPGASLPACVLPPPRRGGGLRAAMSGGGPRDGFVHFAICTSCTVRSSCDGVPRDQIARFGEPRMVPITDERMRRRLAVIGSVETQIKRELVSTSFHRPTSTMDEVIRVQFACNQACRFCFVSTHLPAAEDAQILAAIDAAAARDSRIVLSGGEPTLNPKLADYVAHARARSARTIEIQTNATRLSDRALGDALVAAGAGRFFVSLHGSIAATSDAVTGAPGTFAQTVAGIDALDARGDVDLELNFVMCRTNVADFAGVVRLIGARWKRASLSFSFVATSTDVVPHDRAMIPMYSEGVPGIANGLALAKELGVRVTGFDSMCGIPLCLLPEGALTGEALPAPEDTGDGEEFVRAEACDGCALRQGCYGMRRRYADLYGTSELRRVV